MCGSRGVGGRRAAVGARDRLHELGDLVRLDALLDDDPLDARLLQPAHEFAHRLGGARHRHIADHEVVFDDADRDGGVGGERDADGFGQRADVALDDRMIGRVELRAAQRCREAAGDLLGDLGALRRVMRASARVCAAAPSWPARSCERRGCRCARPLRAPPVVSANRCASAPRPPRARRAGRPWRAPTRCRGERTVRSVCVDSGWAASAPSASDDLQMRRGERRRSASCWSRTWQSSGIALSSRSDNQLLHDRVARGTARDERALQDSEGGIGADLHDGPDGLPLHLLIGVVRAAPPARATPRRRQIPGADRSPCGAPLDSADVFSCSTELRPTAPKSSRISRSARIARVFSSTASASASGRTDAAPSVWQMLRRGGHALDRRRCAVARTMWRISGPAESLSASADAAGASRPRPPVCCSRRMAVARLAAASKIAQQCPALDFGRHDRGERVPADRVVLDPEEIEKQLRSRSCSASSEIVSSHC